MYTASLYLGMGAAIAIGGAVLGLLRNSTEMSVPVLGMLHTWQAAFVAVGLPGLAIALLACTLEEPVRRGTGISAPLARGFSDLRQFFAAHRDLYFGQYLGFAALVTLGYGANAWYPTFWVRVHHWSTADAGIWLGLIGMVMGTAGAILGGFVTDRLGTHRQSAIRLQVAILAALAWIPPLVVHLVYPGDMIAMAAMGVANLFSGITIGLGPTAVQDVVPGRVRGQATALYFFTINLLGLGLGPTLVAAVSSYVFNDDNAIGLAIVVVSFPLVGIGVVLLNIGKSAYLRARAELDAIPRQEVPAAQQGTVGFIGPEPRLPVPRTY